MTTTVNRLWVDDDRRAPEGWDWAKTSAEAIEMLSSARYVEISLDYSLAPFGGDDTRPVVAWMTDNYFPDIVHIHSGSGAGREFLVELVEDGGGTVGNVYSAPNNSFFSF